MRAQTRNWLTATLVIGFLVLLAMILGSLAVQRSADPFLRRPSTFFTDASGARALLMVMHRLLPSAEQWRRPLNMLEFPTDRTAPTTLIVAGPGKPITQMEAEHLDRWLAEGGQLILATDNGWPVKRRVPSAGEEGPEESSGDVAESDPADGQETMGGETFLSRHAPGIRWSKPERIHTQRITGASLPNGELTVQWRRKFSTPADAKVIATAGTAALAVEIAVGQGRIVALADSTMVSNRSVREADNAVWLVTLAAGWGNGKALVDEYHHGFGQKRSVAALTWGFLKTPWGWCVLQVAAAGLLYVFGYLRRFGRVSEPLLPGRSSPLELVEARAGVFQTAGAQGLAAELIVQNVSHDLAKAHGKPVDVSELSHELAVMDKSQSSAKRLAALGALSGKAARGEKLTDQEFVDLGRLAGQIVQGRMA
jgi:hypothetical protein